MTEETNPTNPAPAKSAPAKHWWMALLAALFTGAEGYVSTPGNSLPGSDNIPIGARLAVYMIVMGGGFFLRWWLSRNTGE